MESIQHIEYVAARDSAAQRALEDAKALEKEMHAKGKLVRITMGKTTIYTTYPDKYTNQI
ncbi:MAG: hypothetical protein EOM36_03650 [Bacteroidia bacterium]|nr:hypothetical protein [Bacteroidia bacterium]